MTPSDSVNVPLGRTVATPAALGAVSQPDIVAALRRHAVGDWGRASASKVLGLARFRAGGSGGGFLEDARMARPLVEHFADRNAAANLGVVRRAAIGMLKRAPPRSASPARRSAPPRTPRTWRSFSEETPSFRCVGPGDWGDVTPDDRAANDDAVRSGERLLSVCQSATGTTFWVLTEADRSATTVLLPDDY